MSQASTSDVFVMPNRSDSDTVVHWMAFACLFVGGVQLISDGQMWALWLSMSSLTTVAFVSMLRLMSVPNFATPWSVYATSIGLGYGFGAFNTMSRGYTGGLQLLEVTYANTKYIGKAEGLVLLLVGILLFIGTIDRKKLLPAAAFDSSEKKAALIILALSSLSAVGAVATGNLGYGGGQGAEEGTGRVSPLGSLLVSTMTATLATSVFAFSNEKDKRTKLLVIVLCCMLLLPLILGGRRTFIYAMVVAIMAFFCTKERKELLSRKNIFLLMLVGAMTLVLTKLYFAMRLASYTLGPNPALVDLAKGGWDILMNAEREGLNEANSANQATRTFIIGYFAELLEAGENKTFLGGQLLLQNFVSAVPTVIWAAKWKLMRDGGSDENVCHPVFGLPNWDAANTSLTEGLCDFWLPGVIIYPVLVAAMYSIVNRTVFKAPLLVRCLVCFATIENLFQIENAINAYFVGMRNVFMLAALAWALILALRFLDKLPLVQHHRAQKELHQRKLAELRKSRA